MSIKKVVICFVSCLVLGSAGLLGMSSAKFEQSMPVASVEKGQEALEMAGAIARPPLYLVHRPRA